VIFFFYSGAKRNQLGVVAVILWSPPVISGFSVLITFLSKRLIFLGKRLVGFATPNEIDSLNFSVVGARRFKNLARDFCFGKIASRLFLCRCSWTRIN
jgi:hypothetical protein